MRIFDILEGQKLVKTIIPKYKSILNDTDLTPEKYLFKIEQYLGQRMIKPNDSVNHIGVEIEFIGADNMYIDLMTTILSKGLEKQVVLGWDGSIDTYEDSSLRGYEIKVIDSEKNIFKTLKRVMNILSWYDIEVNESCGLHIHLDGRNRSRIAMYDKLYNMKNILYRMVPDYRYNNSYCQYPDFENYEIGSHSEGIEISKHDTIEVRLHHSTLDFNLIAGWIKLLTKIISTDISKNNKVWMNIPKFVGPELSKYIKTQTKMMRSM